MKEPKFITCPDCGDSVTVQIQVEEQGLVLNGRLSTWAELRSAWVKPRGWFGLDIPYGCECDMDDF